MKNLATAYRPQTFEDIIEQDVVKNILQNQLKNKDIANAYLFCGPSGDGKALPMNADILTPNGYVKMRNINVGDKVIDGLGEITTVLGVYPQGEKDIYKISFNDNTSTECTIDHLWKVHYKLNDTNNTAVMSTHEIMNRFRTGTFNIPVVTLNCFNKQVPINPRLMGFIIKNVVYKNSTYTIKEQPSQYIKTLFNEYGASIIDDEIVFDKGSLLFDLLFNIIDSDNLHPSYLYASQNIKCALINELASGHEFKTKNKKLSDNFAFIVRSCGYVDTIEYINDEYVHEFHSDERQIVNIEYIRKDECQCIYVDSLDHTFITNDLIVTHNTTTARIFAKQLDSEIIEIDAASNNGVENIRDLIQQVNLSSITNTYKIVILDEAHSLTGPAWQALLKTLEEPPKNVIFIFATTDPEKIPKTILSRVQRFNFKRISKDGIAYRLQSIIKKENEEGADILYRNDALDYIAKLANGHMRDAITILNKCLAFENKLTIKRVMYVMNLVDYDVYINLTNNFINNNISENLKIIDNIYNNGIDLKTFIENYINFLIDVNKYYLLKDINLLTLPETQEIVSFLDSVPDTRYILNKFLTLNIDIKYSVNPKYLIEAAILTE